MVLSNFRKEIGVDLLPYGVFDATVTGYRVRWEIADGPYKGVYEAECTPGYRGTNIPCKVRVWEDAKGQVTVTASFKD